MQSDADLIRHILAGEHSEYGVLVERYERQARAAAAFIVKDAHIVEDVAQEAFIIAFQSLPSLKDSSRFGAWLLGIVRRRAARSVRDRCRFPALMDDARSLEESGSAGCLAPKSLELLEFVERLPDHERVLVGLRHFDGHSMKEIADILARPLGTVTKQLSRAHNRLRKWLDEEAIT